jgi:phosphate starvation-inducible membrane PsiE
MLEVLLKLAIVYLGLGVLVTLVLVTTMLLFSFKGERSEYSCFDDITSFFLFVIITTVLWPQAVKELTKGEVE